MLQNPLFVLVCVVAMVQAVVAQAPKPVTATQPAAASGTIEPMSAEIVKLTGSAQYASTDASGTTGAWKEAKVGDRLPAGTRLRTRLRSQVVLMFGDDTVVLIDRATLASIDEFRRTGDTKQVRLALGHGAVRAGVAETTLRSDMTIQTPVATLSKKGTMDFGVEYEPSTGRYKLYLARTGLVEALDEASGERRTLLPGQWMTETMTRWVVTTVFDRAVPLAYVSGLTGADAWFDSNSRSGIAAIDPGGGFGCYSYGPSNGGRPGGGFDFDRGNVAVVGLGIGAAALLVPGLIDGLNFDRRVVRPEGNFGTGNVSLPDLVNRIR